MALDLAASELVKQLRRVGRRPPEKLVQNILRTRETAAGPLLELATDLDLLHEEEPVCYAPIHALRLLGELHDVSIITPLLDQFPVQIHYEDEELPALWSREAPQIIGRLGAEAIEPLWAYADDETNNDIGRGVAFSALTYAITAEPEQRDEVVAELTKRLGSYDDPRMNAFVVAALGDLGIESAYPRVMELYRAGQIDQQAMPPRNARQLLLTKTGKRRITCVNHPLWERYDEHGPFEPQPEY